MRGNARPSVKLAINRNLKLKALAKYEKNLINLSPETNWENNRTINLCTVIIKVNIEKVYGTYYIYNEKRRDSNSDKIKSLSILPI